MSRDQKIGQLFIIPALEVTPELKHLIMHYHIGGIIPKATNLPDQTNLISTVQTLAAIPLFICQDAENGLGMRLKDIKPFPKNEELATHPNLYQIGQQIGEECRQAGIHLNLAPVVDINNNPDNPIIGARSFGEDPHLVAACALEIMKGMQDSGILTCGKHFPGHGDVTIDSHHELPLIPYTFEHLEQIELIPFIALIEAGVDAIMSAHILFPALDKYPATLSHTILTEFLRQRLNFQGILITDALNMKALTNHYSYEEVALLAFRAGNDFLLYGDHFKPNVKQILQEQIPRAIQVLKEQLTDEELDERVLRILKIKEKLDLF